MTTTNTENKSVSSENLLAELDTLYRELGLGYLFEEEQA